MVTKVDDLLRRRCRAEPVGQPLPARQRGRRTGRQVPAAVAADVDEVRLEPIAVDGSQHRLGGRDTHLVLGRATAGEDADPLASIGHDPSSGQSPTNSIS
jgi:hypothetical protein